MPSTITSVRLSLHIVLKWDWAHTSAATLSLTCARSCVTWAVGDEHTAVPLPTAFQWQFLHPFNTKQCGNHYRFPQRLTMWTEQGHCATTSVTFASANKCCTTNALRVSDCNRVCVIACTCIRCKRGAVLCRDHHPAFRSDHLTSFGVRRDNNVQHHDVNAATAFSELNKIVNMCRSASSY